jgi:glutamate racemase
MVASRAYTTTLKSLHPSIDVVEVACPKLVPLVEANRTESEDALAAANEYLAPILARGADAVILGCTHYPFLLRTLEQAAPGVRFVDPAVATAGALASTLHEAGLLETESRRTPHRLLTTGNARAFARQLGGIWPDGHLAVEAISWETISAK